MTDFGSSTFGLFIFYFCVGTVNSSHFGGGIFTWAPARDGSNITVTFRITWESSYATCDDTTIASETLIGSEIMNCFSGCSGTIGSLAFRCKDFMAGQWSSGGNSLEITTGVNQLSYGFNGGGWVGLQEGGGSWYLRATVDLSVRSDTGRINTSPTADMPPVLYWQKDCTYSYTLEVNDVDGDVIRCRWASLNGPNGDECSDVCLAFSGLVVNESLCIITNSASKNVGYYAVALQIEDFADEYSTTPLSSIPLQFLVYIYSGTGCPDPPKLISPTPAPDTQYVLDKGDTLNFVIMARGPDTVVTITTVTRVSEVTSVDSSWNYITLNATWTPSDSDVGQKRRICFYARDTFGVTSDTRCITIIVTENDNDNCNPEPCQNGGTCSDGLGDFNCSCPPGYTGKNCSTVNSSHFGGGIFTWAPASDGSNITITFRMAWGIGSAGCDDTTISSGTLIGLDSMSCFSGCSVTNGNLLYRCTDFKAGQWSSGSNSLVITTEANQLSFGFSSCCWVSLQEGGSNWYLRATVDLSVRSDSGRINTSPTADMPPVLYWQKDCTYSYNLTVNDVDGDVIRCRWASLNGSNGDECSGVCSAFSDLVVNESTCTITNSASKNVGYYAVALQIEDFADESSSTPLSSIPLQFLVYIYSGTGCPDPPQLISPTPVPDTQYVLDKGDTLNLVIKARGPSTVVTMTTVTRVSEVTSVDSSWNYITLNATWTPSDSDVGHTRRFCYYARDTVGVTSETSCITIVVTENDNDNCNPEPCQNGGTCSDGLGDFTCACPPGYTGKNCSTDIDECLATPCENSGTCTDGINDYICTCVPGFTDKNCSTNIDECMVDPCENGGTCTDRINDFTCTCVAGYTDKNCSTNIDECLVTPCENGGTCTDEINAYTCTCAPGFTDKNCSTNINECMVDPCENGGTCADGINDFTCTCVAGYTDRNCSTNIDECIPDPCENGGTCTDEINGFTCTCVSGYTDTKCTTNIDECIGDPCDNGGNCTDGINDYTCACVPGYTGKNCSVDIDECLVDPCGNGGTCTDEINDYTCACVPGYTGKNCSSNIDECMGDPCENGGTCTDGLNDYTCTCVPGYTDKNCSTNIDECLANPCDNSGTCIDEINNYTCLCVPGYTDKNCSSDIDECIGDPCKNFATCTDGINDYTCTCVPGYSGKNCSTDINECMDDPCENDGTCIDELNDYTCTCVPGYAGKNCTTNIDECLAGPCKNGGTCNDEINDYTCTCVPGYTDKNCSTNIDECLADPCENGGTCNDEINDYTCTCVPGYRDKNCSTNIDECIAAPCKHGGTCTDGINDYTCLCVPGYSDKNCSTNIDECLVAPCDNGGICFDEINDYTCACVPGYTDKNCSTNIDECIEYPCENDGFCIDEVNDYTCTCVPGYTDKNCSTNIDDCLATPCENGGNCSDGINDYTCTCVPGFTDKNCSTNINECEPAPCQNDGTCIDLVNGFKCECPDGFTGEICRPGKIGDDCRTRAEVCVNIPYVECNGSICQCVDGYQTLVNNETCSRVDCMRVPTLNHGNVVLQYENDTKYGAVGNVSCDEGFVPSIPTVMCQANGTWSLPACVRKKCPSIVVPENGKIISSNGSSFGSVITFSCNTSYFLIGNESVLCNSTGQWNTDIPLCKKKVTIGSKCENSNFCQTPRAKCINNTCTCYTGIYNAAADVCDAMFLYKYGEEAGDAVLKSVDDACTPPILFSNGIPIFDNSHKTLYVCTNGLISFNQTYFNPIPYRNTNQYGTRTIVAPFFADTDTSNAGSVHYRYFDILTHASMSDNEDIKHAQFMIEKLGNVTEFSAKFILFVTWHRVTPFQGIFTNGTEATFQAVLASNGTDTYTLFIYGYNSMLWNTKVTLKPSLDIWIGYTASKKYTWSNINSFKLAALKMDSVAEAKGISGILFNRLTPVGGRPLNAAIQCLDWYNKIKHSKAEFETVSNELPDCPCNLESLSFDPWFWPKESPGTETSAMYTVEILPSELFGRHGKSCAFNKTTGLWTDEFQGAGGFYINHQTISPAEHVRHDINSKEVCCERSGLCQLYYDLHPVGKCYTETWFETGTSWGDPHFVTLDKKEFTFNGLGEYELIHLVTSGKDFTLQARTSRPEKKDGSLSYATIFTAFAAKDHTNASFHVELNKAKDGPILYANSADLSLSFKNQNAFRYKSEENNVVVIRKNDTLFIFFPNIGISLNITVGAEMLAISATVPKKYNSTTRGLLGNFDNDPENDFVYPNGTILPGNISEKDVFYFGQSWQIDEEKSVFLYSEGMKPEDFRNASYVPKFLEDAVKENQTKVEEAERLCGGLKYTQCVFDFLFTLKEDIAKNTRKRKEIADVVSSEIRKRIPTLAGCQVLNITKGDEVRCKLTMRDEETLKIKFIENNVKAVYEEKENSVVYRQDTDTPIKISISVENEDNKTSPPFRIKVQMCTGCSGHGYCTDVKRSDPKETEDFKYWECKCEPQYEGLDCEKDFDGCAASPCSLGRECETLFAVKQKELNKTHLCGDCPDGFLKKDEDKCEDIDECEDNRNLCEHTCVNTDGSFECTCNQGYRKNSRNTSLCDDINECDEALHNCTQECINTIGGFNCTCKAGFNFISANWTCETAIGDVCSTAGIDCHRTAGCTIDENSQATCFCESGFELSENKTTCNDINECDSNVCPQLCYNTYGGFECACHNGYMIQDGTCEECEYPFWGKSCLNECKCSGQGTLGCDPVRGCVCDEGWTGDACDDDIDECEDKVDPCQNVRKECVNAPGGYTCTCTHGFNEKDDECIDIDECSSPVLNDCTQACFNTVGGYTCGCLEGFTKYNRTFCQDIDECKLRKDDCEQRCGNFPGLYNCYCYFGYTINDDRKTCEKVSDPCKTELNLTCSHHCVTSRDSASCQCRRGYILAADKQACLDVDECKENLHECSTEAECINTDGSYLCKCLKGSKLENNGRTCFECDEFHYGENCARTCSCLNGYCDKISGCICDPGWSGINCDKDTDECVGDVCAEAYTDCINTPGSFICRCQSGYQKNNGLCEDIDECSNVKMNNCDQNCTNTLGSYTCRCEAGFAFKDGKCLDLDECRGVSKCDHICDNTVGSFRCTCHEGFKLNLTDRQSCIPCAVCNEENIRTCKGKNADCTVVNEKFNCFCPKGFKFNNNDSCEDIPECSEIPPRCGQNCKETNGGFECSCKPGFYLLSDGISCQGCENGQYGKECLSSCDCILENTKVCRPENGSCECISGWGGTTCEVDVNECNDGALINCPKHSVCVNTNGSFFCKCDIGYFKTGEGSCEKCDKQHYGKDCSHECSCEIENTDLCDNVNGECTCRQGWKGEFCTLDIDECKEVGNVCAEQNHTKCRNTKGSYKCDCLDGYLSQNQLCIDKDECLEGTAACLQECINTVGGYVCDCSLGYSGHWNTCEVCSGNRYGKNCTSPCVCNTTNSVNELQSCDTVTGACKCKTGWEGDTCERDRNECLSDDICAAKENTVCINSPGSYICDCKRSFVSDNGICVEKEEPSTVPGQGYTAIQLTVRFDTALPSGMNLNSSSGYETVSRMVYLSLYDFYNLVEKAKLWINDIRHGSIVVDYSIIYPSEDTELGNNITYDSISLVKGRQIHFDGKPVTVTVLGPFSNESDVCEIYASIRGHCPTATECTAIDNKPTCREIVVEDKFSLIIGIGVGTLFILLSVLICVFFTRRLRIKVQDEKGQTKRANRLHRDDDFFPSRKQAPLRKSKITKNPVFPEMNKYVTCIPRQGQIGRNIMRHSSKSGNFGFSNDDRFVPRLDPSVFLRNQLDPMDEDWQPDYDITIDYSD